jgi:hypothetical protein
MFHGGLHQLMPPFSLQQFLLSQSWRLAAHLTIKTNEVSMTQKILS